MTHLLLILFFISIPISIYSSDFQELFNNGTHEYYNEHYNKAIDLFTQALQLNPHSAQAECNLGILYKDIKEYAAAIEHLERAVTLQPNYPKAFLYLAQCYEQINNKKLAQKTYKALLEQNPNSFEAHKYLARMYERSNKPEQALKHAQSAYTLHSENLENTFRYAYLLTITDKPEQAYGIYKTLHKEHPYTIPITYNFAYISNLLHKREHAIELYQNVLDQEQNHYQAHLGYAKALLSVGRLQEGFKEFEWRIANFIQHKQNYKKYPLTSNDLKNKTILLRAEWGLGDMVHFIRYAQLVKQHAQKVIVQTYSALVPLFKQCPYIDIIIPVGTVAPPHHLQIPLLSLPYIFGTNLETIPAQIPYLYADKKLVADWKQKLKKDTNFKVGICWHSKQIYLEKHKHTRRSIPLQLFEPLSKIPGVSLYSLQKIDGEEELQNITFSVHTFGKDFDESHGRFMDTAAVIENIDLLISVDTSVVHIAGALGKPVWVMAPYTTEWRWLQNRDDSPWYPTIKIFRQTEPSNWQSVIQQVTQKLTELTTQGN